MRHYNEDVLSFAAGVAAGAALMYMMDPAIGRRRRAIARDKAYSSLHRAEDRIVHRARDFRNRAEGTVANLKNRVGMQHEDVDDDILLARVRAELGHVCRHPRAITATAHDGTVTLSGNVLREEMDAICKGVSRVRGVREVVKNLVEHETAGSVSELQG